MLVPEGNDTKSQERFKSGAHNIYTKEIDKIALVVIVIIM